MMKVTDLTDLSLLKFIHLNCLLLVALMVQQHRQEVV